MNPLRRQPDNRTSGQPDGNFRITKYCLIPLAALLVFACTKPDALVSETPIVYRTPVFSDPPTAVGDRLYFDDFAQFTTYYLELDSLLNEDADLFDSIVLADSPVQTINDLLTTDEYTTTPFQTFLTDPVMRAVVNPYYEFEIDDVLVTYINNSEILTSDASNSSLRTSIRAITKGEPLDINEIPSGAFWSDDRDLEEALAIVCGCTISIRPYDCDELRVFGRCNSFFGGDGDGEVTIEYDQAGAPISYGTILNEEVSGNFEFLIDIGFRQSGYIRATIDPECVTASNKVAGFTYDASTYASCDEGERSSPPEDITNGNERMWIHTAYYINWIGAYMHSAEIKGWTWSGSKWENKKAALKVRVDANRKSVGCDLLDSKDDEKDCNNCKHKVVRVSWTNPVAHCDGDLVGTFRKSKSGVVLNDEQEVDFICCE